MRSALASVDGVEDVKVDYASQTATVTCSSGCSPDDLVSALKGANYTAEVQ